jgi:hypothetical protein
MNHSELSISQIREMNTLDFGEPTRVNVLHPVTVNRSHGKTTGLTIGTPSNEVKSNSAPSNTVMNEVQRVLAAEQEHGQWNENRPPQLPPKTVLAISKYDLLRLRMDRENK